MKNIKSYEIINFFTFQISIIAERIYKCNSEIKKIKVLKKERIFEYNKKLNFILYKIENCKCLNENLLSIYLKLIINNNKLCNLFEIKKKQKNINVNLLIEDINNSLAILDFNNSNEISNFIFSYIKMCV